MKWAMICRARDFRLARFFWKRLPKNRPRVFFRRLGAGYLAELFSRAGRFRGLGLVAGVVFSLGVAVEVPKNAVRAFSNESCVIVSAGFISAS